MSEPNADCGHVVLAVVGSTDFAKDQQAAVVARRHIMNAIATLKPVRVVSGGAVGIDSIAANYAKSLGLEVTEYLPKRRRWAPDGFKERNLQIAQDCTHLLRIAHGDSRTYGSGWTADQAEKMGKHVERITVPAGRPKVAATPFRNGSDG